MKLYEQAVEQAKAEGGTVECGGKVTTLIALETRISFLLGHFSYTRQFSYQTNIIVC